MTHHPVYFNDLGVCVQRMHLGLSGWDAQYEGQEVPNVIGIDLFHKLLQVLLQQVCLDAFYYVLSIHIIQIRETIPNFEKK